MANDKDCSVASGIFKESLDLLEWPRVCENISTFASTSEGIRRCKDLDIPSDLSTSELRLQETIEIGLLDQTVNGGLSFHGISCLTQTLARCSKGAAVSGKDLISVADTLAAARRLRRQIDEPQLRPVITALLGDLATLPDLEKSLRFGLEEGGRIADRASSALKALRGKLQGIRTLRRNRLQDLMLKYGSVLQDSLIAERNGRSVLAIKAPFAAQVPGIVQDSSASGGTVFIEHESVITLGNQIVRVESEIIEEQQRLLAEWSALVASYFDPLTHLQNVMIHLDLALARSRYGVWMGGVPPILKEESDASFQLKEFRHPLLLWQARNQQLQEVVPISLEVDSKTKVVAITGPNTGGKTVTIKSIGLAALMARSGLLLPCQGTPILPWCNQILVDIGDEQSLQQSLSTFSSHITRIARILCALRERPGPSLVLLDEVGAGTDPSEGTALAIALLRTLAERARLTIATTHFGELKALKYNDSRFENASVAFNSETITPTYQLQWGIPGKSNALVIAERLGIDPLVTERAKELISLNRGEDVNKVIYGLEEQRRRQQEAAEEAAILLAKTELLHDELLARWEKQSQESERFQERARQKLITSINQGQQEVSNLIRRLREGSSDGETARQVGQRLRQINEEHQSQVFKPNQKDWFPKIGDQVRLLALGKAGEVVDISEDGCFVTIQCGAFRSKVELTGLESIDGLRATPSEPLVRLKTKRRLVSGSQMRNTSNTLDVRGLRVHEAEVAVEEFVRTMAGPIWVIHGVGTGKLKKGLRQWLETLPYVGVVKDADPSDGGVGCTVIWLK